MKQEHTNFTVILLLDGESAAENDSAKKWFEESPFLTNEAINIFQVLEEIGDFTVRHRPDIVLLEVNSLSEDFLAVKQLVQTMTDGEEIPVFALSDLGGIVKQKNYFAENPARLKISIDQIIPELASCARSAV